MNLRFAVLLPVLVFGAPACAEHEDVVPLRSPVPFRGVARLQTLRSRGRMFSARTTYPRFLAPTPLARFASARIRMARRGAYLRWLKNTQVSLHDDPNPLAAYEYSSVPALVHCTPRLLSLRFDGYEYDGGAHGLGFSQMRNFGLVAGKPKILALGDFFRPGTLYRTLVETKIFAKLRKNPGAMWVAEGSVKTLEIAQFNNFSVERDGLRWLFNPYEMGPYAAGQLEIKLSLNDLGRDFRRDLLR